MSRTSVILVGAMSFAGVLFSVAPSAADNTVYCGQHEATIVGTPDDDVLIGTPNRDVIHGLAGDDEIHGMGGTDIICGGSGDDILFDGEGRDELFGQYGSDTLHTTLDGEVDLIDGGYGVILSRNRREHDLCVVQVGLVGSPPKFEPVDDGEISHGCEDGAVDPVFLPD